MKISKSLVLLLTLFTLSCEKEKLHDPESTDSRKTFIYNGFTYHIVTIGNQEWMVENLQTSAYNDGSVIVKIQDHTSWNTEISGAHCFYDNSDSVSRKYGYLYNWYTVASRKLVPSTGGWRIASESDWQQLLAYAGEGSGEKLKSVSNWDDDGNGTDNFGFTALPGGFRNEIGFSGKGKFACFWIQSEYDSLNGKSLTIKHQRNATPEVLNRIKNSGFSVRLVRDTDLTANHNPSKPFGPFPANDSTGLGLDLTLSWSASDPDGDGLRYDIFLDTNAVPAKKVGYDYHRSFYYANSLKFGKKYFWKVNAFDAKGAMTEGLVWSFSTLSNSAPTAPALVFPEMGSTDINLNPTLKWTGNDPDNDILTYDIYLDTVSSPVQLVSVNSPKTTFTVFKKLNYGKVYYWKVIARDSRGSKTESPVWSFTTEKMEIYGDWVSAGDHVAPLLNSIFASMGGIDTIYASFAFNQVFSLKYILKNKSVINFSGTFSREKVFGSQLRKLTLDQQLPTFNKSEGIYGVDTSDQLLTIEVVLTSGGSSNVPPTPEAGFGSTNGGVFGMANVQQFVRKK